MEGEWLILHNGVRKKRERTDTWCWSVFFPDWFVQKGCAWNWCVALHKPESNIIRIRFRKETSVESSVLHPEWKKRLSLVFGKCSSAPRWVLFCILAGSSLCFALRDLYFIHWWECWMISVSEIFIFLSSLHSEFEGFRRAGVYRERQTFAILFARIGITYQGDWPKTTV